MSDPIHVNMPQLAVRPEVLLLWNGVPLQELGIDMALVSVSFTTTCGRSKGSKKYPSGKPKVGGAQVVFELSNAKIAEVLARLLHSDTRPNISISFGYQGSDSYWVGSMNAAQVVDNKKYKKASSFKVDRASWSYSASGIPKLTINGVSDTAVKLATNISPRVYSKSNIKKILEGVADDNGLILDIDEDLPSSTALEYVIKASEESDFAFVDRLASLMGADAYLIDGVGEYGASGVTNRFKLSGNTEGVNLARMRDTVRGILRVSKLPGFMDLSKYDQARPLIIGYGANMGAEERHACDLLASSVSIEDIRHGGGPASGKPRAVLPKAAGGAYAMTTAVGLGPGFELMSFVTAGTAVGLSVSAVEYARKQLGRDRKQEAVDRAELQRRQAAELASEQAKAYFGPTAYAALVPDAQVAGGPVQAKDTKPQAEKSTAVRAVPEDIEPTGALTSAQLAKLALKANFEFEISITLKPGVPYIQAPFQIELRGTHAHDGEYSVEEATTSWGGGGLESTLKIRPIKFKPTTGGGTKKKDAPAQNPELYMVFDSIPGKAGGESMTRTQVGVQAKISPDGLARIRRGLAGEKRDPNVPYIPEGPAIPEPPPAPQQ